MDLDKIYIRPQPYKQASAGHRQHPGGADQRRRGAGAAADLFDPKRHPGEGTAPVRRGMIAKKRYRV